MSAGTTAFDTAVGDFVHEEYTATVGAVFHFDGVVSSVIAYPSRIKRVRGVFSKELFRV